ncbi:arginase [Lysobacter firmicutimachus]|uniref:Arginase n=1 Tax=Lysobacter firmicutimachus TaxID=1792846 RepID=A0AAU8MU22_9GAMM
MTRSATPVSLIGAPTDVGAGARGARLGPEALRIAGLTEALRGLGLDVADRGNLDGPPNPWSAPVGGYRHLDEVVAWNRNVMDAVAAELREERMPILLGGDHCLGLGSITAVARHCRERRKKLRVLWLDAHADFNTHEITPTGNLHGMPVACLIGMGPPCLTRLGGEAPAMQVGEMRQIGTRSVDPGERQLIKQLGLPVYDMRRIGDIGIKRVMEEALDGVDADTHLHVSFDVDFLDPSIAPGVGTVVAGGPNYREAQLAMEMIAESGCMGSLDIVELNPILDRDNHTALVAIDLVESLFGKSTLARA